MALTDLVSSGIIERDTHGDVLWVWSYPAVTSTQRELFLQKCCLSDGVAPLQPFIYSQYNKQWYYIYTSKVTSSTLPQVTHVSLVLVSKDFNPEKYETMAPILLSQYTRTGSPAAMLESYLSVVTRGSCNSDENGMFVAREYETRQAYAAAGMRDVIARFGMEVILIVTAMLLKKRIVIYHSNVEDLLTFARSLPAFVWHRQNWSMVYPLLQLGGVDMENLRSSIHYVAGFTDASIENRSDLYDLCVNLNTSEITVAPHAREVFSMGKTHKDLAMFIVECAEDESKSDQLIIKNIAIKIKELLNTLKNFATTDEKTGRPVVCLETLRERKMAATTENLLFGLAAAEGLVRAS